jgi:protein-S-isoprenylcysteine O-methyltransferase Ste14
MRSQMTSEDMAHLNFMKQQQWTTTYYVVLLLSGIFAVKTAFAPLTNFEQLAGTVFASLVLAAEMLLLCFIQCDIGRSSQASRIRCDRLLARAGIYTGAWSKRVRRLPNRDLRPVAAPTRGGQGRVQGRVSGMEEPTLMRQCR